jgi:23S rRNA pseudouridine1911/1915/1917 synthase
MPHFKFTSLQANRLDKIITDHITTLSRSAAQKLIGQDKVWVNGVNQPASYFVKVNDIIELNADETQHNLPQPEAIALDVMYEDADVLVINKPAGMVVHPGVGNNSGTVVNALLAHANDLGEFKDTFRPGIVHRLDKETSGVMLLAKTEMVQKALQDQFKAREVQKTYIAILVGAITPQRGIINKPIARDIQHRQRMAIVASGRDAVTEYELIAELPKAEYNAIYSVVRCYPRTGRTHQLRVHFASMGYPIVGDATYGAVIVRRDLLSQKLTPRHLLHANRIQFRLPSSARVVTFTAPPPDDMSNILANTNLS